MSGMLRSAFDKEEDGDVIIRGKPSLRPRDAATLILVRRDQAQPRVLMGKRAGTNAFMPDKYVFPAGALTHMTARRLPGRNCAQMSKRNYASNRAGCPVPWR